MKKVRVEEAVGLTLCHDITKVVPGQFKGAAFKRNHIIKPEDVGELLSIGKEHIYVWEENAGEVHEDDAAIRIGRAAMGKNVNLTGPEEGKVILKATARGLFKVKGDLLGQINAIKDVTIPTIPNNFPVEAGQKVAGARIVPLVTREENILQVEQLCASFGPLLYVEPYRKLKAGIIITGSEVYKGRIRDKFGPVIQEKMKYFAAEILGQEYCPDEPGAIEEKIFQFKEKSADLIIVTGGMSVDPDDLTPGAIKNTGAEIIIYGLPVQPGNMFMLAYLDGIPVLGVPGAATYFKTTVLDVVLPKIFTGEKISKNELIKMGEGGLCLGCQNCHYPNCYFGR
jgi:molybdenum cofactor synthesis domain-containing protein